MSCLLIKCCKYFVFLLVDFGSFHSRVDNVINDSFNYTVTRHRWNCQELKYIIFRSALAHLQRTTCSQNYFRFSSYLLRKTAFICNIDRDWMIYHKHPIRSLLTSMLRKASFRYPWDALVATSADSVGREADSPEVCRLPWDVYALSFEKYKGK